MPKRSLLKNGIAKTIAEDSVALDRVVQQAREDLVRAIQLRAKQLGMEEWQSETMLRGLRSLLTRLEQVHLLSRAFLIQTHPEHAPSQDDAVVALEECIGAVETLFAIEVEARAAQARLAQSASVLEYTGNPRPASRVMTLRVDQYVSNRFKMLAAKIRQERMALVGHSPSISPEELLNLLLSLGECNVKPIALMGCAYVPGARERAEVEVR